ncbi:MAG: antitoxin Xre-like helix-turn-helix domain-containing protein [Burkholderiales bacterium]
MHPVIEQSANSLLRKNLSAPALRTVFRIFEAWGLPSQQQIKLLGNPPRSTFCRWKRIDKIVLPQDTLERISYLFGIYSALQTLLPKPVTADAWLKNQNEGTLFGGRSALLRMLGGQVADLYIVRQFLDAQRGL